MFSTARTGTSAIPRCRVYTSVTPFYKGVRGLDDLQPLSSTGWCIFRKRWWIRRWKQIPAAWLEGQEDELTSLLDRLLLRRKRVPDLIAGSRGEKINPFPPIGKTASVTALLSAA